VKAVRIVVSIIALTLFGPSLFAGARILLVDSYHEGYPWSDGVCEGASKVLKGKAELKIIRMDTKRNNSEEFKVSAGAKAYQEVLDWKPDLVIASDDNAVKYMLIPYLKGKDIPCVFCGLNWDASIYGLPDGNCTGMIEVTLIKPLFTHLRKFAKGDRLGFLGADNETDRKEGFWISSKLERKMDSRYVRDFEEWKASFLEMQTSNDMLIFYSYAGIKGWDEGEAKDFVMKNTKIPTGSTMEFMTPFTVLTFAKSPEEQGEWSAKSALKILGGVKPSEIPLAENKRTVIYLNIPLAESMNLKFPIDLIKTSKVIR
jgi:hypothetical protein